MEWNGRHILQTWAKITSICSAQSRVKSLAVWFGDSVPTNAILIGDALQPEMSNGWPMNNRVKNRIENWTKMVRLMSIGTISGLIINSTININEVELRLNNRFYKLDCFTQKLICRLSCLWLESQELRICMPDSLGSNRVYTVYTCRSSTSFNN